MTISEDSRAVFGLTCHHSGRVYILCYYILDKCTMGSDSVHERSVLDFSLVLIGLQYSRPL